MKKLTMLLSVLALAFFASACSESPMGLDTPTDSALTGAEASWGSTTWKPKPTDPNKKQPEMQRRSTSGYALGM